MPVIVADTKRSRYADRPWVLQTFLSSNVRHHQTNSVALLARSASVRVAAIALLVHSAAAAVSAPNVVVIDAKLVTSGQPSATALAGLKTEGFQAVVYLAPSSVSDAVKEEPSILANQHIEFVHIPSPFGTPTDAHFDAVSATLTPTEGQEGSGSLPSEHARFDHGLLVSSPAPQ